MPNYKRLPERERKRLATRRQKYGKDFERINARTAGLNSTTKFNPETARAAAKKRWDTYRKEKARKMLKEQQNNKESK